MATFIPLGSRAVTAAKDITGTNTGNLTTRFDVATLGFKVPYIEIYHAAIADVPSEAVATIYINNQLWGFTAPGAGSSAGAGTEWAPPWGMLLRPGDEVNFLWSVPAATTPVPVVTLWLRFDIDIPANRAYA